MLVKGATGKDKTTNKYYSMAQELDTDWTYEPNSWHISETIMRRMTEKGVVVYRQVNI